MTARNRPGAQARVGVVVATVLAALVAAAPGGAHSTLLRSDPPDSGLASVGRRTLNLWFTEPISTKGSRFVLSALDGTRVGTTAAVSSDNGQGFVHLEMAPLSRATYRLEWSVSALDGHPSSGTMVFGVGVRPSSDASGGAAFPDVMSLVIRWFDLAALMLMIGALAVSWRVFSSLDDHEDWLRRRALSVGAIAASVAVVCGAIVPFDRTPRGGASFISWLDATRIVVTDTSWGRLWSAREAALVLAAFSLWAIVALRRSARRLSLISAAAVVVVVVIEAWAGHASSLPRQRGLGVAASSAHLTAAGVWAGGLAVMAVCLLPLMRRGHGARRPLFLTAWRRFSPMAAVCTVVLLATGLYESGREVPDLGSLRSTVYGGAIGAKLALLAIALAVAGLNTLCVNPRLAAPVARILGRPPGWTPVPARRFPAAVVAELAVLVVAVVAAAVLTSVPPAREIAASSRESGPVAANVDGMFVTFEDAPAGEGASLLIVRARSTVKPDPAPIDGVEVYLDGPEGMVGPVTLDPVEPGRYEAPTVSLAVGNWLATIAVHRRRLPATVARIEWRVADTTSARAGAVEVVTTALAALLLALALAALAVAARRDVRARSGSLDSADHIGRASPPRASET